MVYRALNEVIALHTVLVRGQVSKLVEVRRAGLELLQFPVVPRQNSIRAERSKSLQLEFV